MKSSLETNRSDWPELWQATYRILEDQVVPNQLRAWIQPLEWEKSEQNESKIQVFFKAQNDFSAAWVRDQYQGTIEKALTQVTGKTAKIEVSAKEGTENAEPQLGARVERSPLTLDPTDSHPMTKSTPIQPVTKGVVLTTNEKQTSLEAGLDPRYTFETYVVGNSNQFAHASAAAVAESPAQQYNPLFIYSEPGLGKTHLLHAIGNHVLSKNPQAKVRYISAESFVNELIESIQHHKMSQFRSLYRNSYDILLIDDVQFIAGRKKTEEEFFHTFNALYGSKRQIVLASDRPPKEIESLEQRLVTRFEWGLVSDITAPEIETRIAILKSKAELDDIYLPDDIATFLATYVKDNVRELEGILIRLQAQAALTGAEISMEMAKHELRAAVPEQGSQLTVETIQEIVAKHFGIKVTDLKSTSRMKSIALPRQIAMYLIRKYTGLGFKDIGNHFGGKDHTTILHAYHKIDKSYEKDVSIREAVEAIQNQL
ncbi:MAG: chromosomal replication initiator protein DnaA [Bdellovibrionaceae bacterium]|nr:chromosomal replication initiator protein DnaA [Pseudobdellovibrionaceae bacterium]